MLNSDELRFAIEDARTRQGTIIGLVYAIDQQAMTLLGLYITLGLAAASGFVASRTAGSAISPELGWGLLAAAVAFALGAYWCFKVVETAIVNLPGRQAEFWLWADGPKITADDAMRQYLNDLQGKHEANDAVNAKSSRAMRHARQIGLASIPAAVVVAIGCLYVPMLFS